jgi:ATP-dependent DNA helicase RecQ
MEVSTAAGTLCSIQGLRHFPSMMNETLERYFGFSHFRPGQEEAIHSVVIDKRPTFVVLPTSTGKTLIFQFITILNRQRDPSGVTIVISPLIALMTDQVEKWNRDFMLTDDGHIEKRTDGSVDRPVAVLLGSAQEDPMVEPNALRGLYPVVYMAPEKLPFLPKSIVGRVKLLVIDECHCISEHGNSFRPAYREIRPFFETVPTLALTATAPPDIQADILANLALDTPNIIRMSMYRPNLRLLVRHKRMRKDDLLTIRQLIPSEGRTVIFGTTRSECESLAKSLGKDAQSYHAGLSTEERAQVLSRFVTGSVLVATNCFGLGVDIPDIRLVVHYGLPRSLLGYAQECGRAGRDGVNATCLLFFASSDISKYNDNERDVRLAVEMLTWTKDIRCRRHTLLTSFGEDFAQDGPCVWGSDLVRRGCDVCDNAVDSITPVQTVNAEDIRLLLQAVDDTGNHAGKSMPVDFLLGSKSKKLARFVHKVGSAYRRGTHKTKAEWIAIHAQLTKLYLLREVATSRGFIVYKLTDAGRHLL